MFYARQFGCNAGYSLSCFHGSVYAGRVMFLFLQGKDASICATFVSTLRRTSVRTPILAVAQQQHLDGCCVLVFSILFRFTVQFLSLCGFLGHGRQRHQRVAHEVETYSNFVT